jgi:ankyrin repeat protein
MRSRTNSRRWSSAADSPSAGTVPHPNPDITTNSENSWRDFWTNVYRNNERLKLYCE